MFADLIMLERFRREARQQKDQRLLRERLDWMSDEPTSPSAPPRRRRFQEGPGFQGAEISSAAINVMHAVVRATPKFLRPRFEGTTRGSRTNAIEAHKARGVGRDQRVYLRAVRKRFRQIWRQRRGFGSKTDIAA